MSSRLPDAREMSLTMNNDAARFVPYDMLPFNGIVIYEALGFLEGEDIVRY